MARHVQPRTKSLLLELRDTSGDVTVLAHQLLHERTLFLLCHAHLLLQHHQF